MRVTAFLHDLWTEACRTTPSKNHVPKAGLTPSIDHLFDRGFIGFEDAGELIISPVAHRASLHRMGVETERRINVGSFTEGQRHFLEFHRNAVLLRASR